MSARQGGGGVPTLWYLQLPLSQEPFGVLNTPPKSVTCGGGVEGNQQHMQGHKRRQSSSRAVEQPWAPFAQVCEERTVQ